MHRRSSWVYETAFGKGHCQNITMITFRKRCSTRWVITLWCTNLFPCLERRKFQIRKLQWTETGRSSGKSQRGIWIEWRAREVLFWTDTKRKGKSTLPHWWTLVISRMPSCNKSTKKHRGRIALRGKIVKDDSGAYQVFTERGSSASQMTAAKVVDVIARLPECAGQAADAVSAFTQVKMEDAPKLLEIQKSECPDIWIRLPRHKWPQIVVNHRRPSRSSRTKPVRSGSGAGKLVGKTVWGGSVGTCIGKSTELGLSLCSPKTRIGLIGTRGWFRNGWKAAENSKFECPDTMILINTEKGSNHEFLQLQLKNYQDGRHLTQKRLRGPATWKDMPKNALRVIANWQTTRQKNCTKFQLKKEELETVGEFSDACSQIVLKCWYSARIGRLAILWSVNNLARSVTKWTRTCERRLARLISNIHHTSDYRHCCHVGITVQHCRFGSFQDSDSARKTWKIQNQLQVNLVYFRTQNICSHKLDVLEANVSVSQFYRIRDNITGCWIAHGRCSCSWFASRGPALQKELRETAASTSNVRLRKVTRILINCQISITWPQTQIPVNVKHSCAFFEDSVAVIKMDHQRTKSDDETRIQNPQSRVRLVVWRNQLGPQDPNQICWHQKPTRRLVE